MRQLIDELRLEPHPEGGWYREIYRSPTVVQTARGQRPAITTIHYLLAAGQASRWHAVDSDEIWHFYRGEPLELLTYVPSSRKLVRYELCHSGEQVAVVPAGVWQAARPLGAYSLVGCTVGPGFDFADFRFVSTLPEHVEHLAGAFGKHRDLL
jgi:predicted cupin superfamily sugar epimerase